MKGGETQIFSVILQLMQIMEQHDNNYIKSINEKD